MRTLTGGFHWPSFTLGVVSAVAPLLALLALGADVQPSGGLRLYGGPKHPGKCLRRISPSSPAISSSAGRAPGSDSTLKLSWIVSHGRVPGYQEQKFCTRNWDKPKETSHIDKPAKDGACSTRLVLKNGARIFSRTLSLQNTRQARNLHAHGGLHTERC